MFDCFVFEMLFDTSELNPVLNTQTQLMLTFLLNKKIYCFIYFYIFSFLCPLFSLHSSLLGILSLYLISNLFY